MSHLNGKTVITTYHNYGAFLNGGDKRPVLVKLVSVILTIVSLVDYVVKNIDVLKDQK